jgi:outer membrane protein TolC
MTLFAAAAAAAVAGAGAALTLEDAIARAYEVHPDLVAADARVEKARLAYEQLQTEGYALSADLTGRFVGSQNNILATSGAAMGSPAFVPTAAGSIGLTVPIWNGGKTGEALKAANLSEDAAKADRDAARRDLTLDVAKAFWSARQAELAEGIQGESAKQAQRAVTIAEAGLSAGRQTAHDVDQAAQSYNAALAESYRQKAQTAVALATLGNLLKQDLGGMKLIGDPPEAPPPVPRPTSDDVEAALARRPDYLALQARVAVEEAQLGAARGDYWPQLSFTAQYQHGNNQVDQITGTRSLGAFAGQWDALLTARYNLFDLGKTRRSVASADQDVRESRARLEGLRSQLRTGIENAWTKASLAQTRLSFSDRAVDLARRNQEWTIARRAQGFGLAIEVDDARSKLAIAETQRLNSRIEYVVAMAELQAALGELK